MKKHIYTRVLLAAAFVFPTAASFAQFNALPTTNICPRHNNDYVLDNNQYDRLGHLQSGTYGNYLSQWANIGICDVTQFAPANCNYYGFTSNWSSDRAFFGLRYDGYDKANAIIAFGDNVGAPDTNRLIFQFDSYIPSQSLEIGTMWATGNFGLHTATPTATLHIDAAFKPLDPGTNSNVRFENLQTGRGNILMIDNNGYVYDSKIAATGGGTGNVSSACVTANFLPKVLTAGSPNLDCSQVYDNGTSVGIGTTGSFGFTVTNTNNVQPGPWLSVSSGTLRLKVNGITMSDGYLISSDARYKKNITPFKNALEKIQKLNGVFYNWDTDKFPDRQFTTATQIGFIAQDVEKVIPDIVYKDEQGYNSVNYTSLIPVLVEAIKEQQKTIEELQKKVNSLSGSTGMSAVSDGTDMMTISPNPSNASTRIQYNFSNNNGNGAIMIFDLNGRLIRKIAIDADSNNIILPKGSLNPGMYVVSLLNNGSEIASKKLIITE